MSIIPTRSYGADPSPLFPPSAILHYCIRSKKVKADDEAILHMDPTTKCTYLPPGLLSSLSSLTLKSSSINLTIPSQSLSSQKMTVAETSYKDK